MRSFCADRTNAAARGTSSALSSLATRSASARGSFSHFSSNSTTFDETLRPKNAASCSRIFGDDPAMATPIRGSRSSPAPSGRFEASVSEGFGAFVRGSSACSMGGEDSLEYQRLVPADLREVSIGDGIAALERLRPADETGTTGAALQTALGHLAILTAMPVSTPVRSAWALLQRSI
jgi:hypothetical protein